MLPQKNINAIKTIYKLFTENSIQWKLAGSSNLALQGVPVDASDVDIAVNTSDVDIIQKLFAAYTIEPIKYSQTDKFRSYFGRFTIDNCLVVRLCVSSVL